MGKIKSKETGIEKRFREILWKKGLRYRKNNTKLYGKPDISNKSKRIVVFIDSCFWHGCKKHLRIPEQNKKYWKNKIKRNIERDKIVNKYYKKEGWKLFRIWEHDFKNRTVLEKEIKNIFKKYKNK